MSRRCSSGSVVDLSSLCATRCTLARLCMVACVCRCSGGSSGVVVVVEMVVGVVVVVVSSSE